MDKTVDRRSPSSVIELQWLLERAACFKLTVTVDARGWRVLLERQGGRATILGNGATLFEALQHAAEEVRP